MYNLKCKVETEWLSERMRADGWGESRAARWSGGAVYSCNRVSQIRLGLCLSVYCIMYICNINIYLFKFNKNFGYFGLNRNIISKTEPNRNYFRFKPKNRINRIIEKIETEPNRICTIRFGFSVSVRFCSALLTGSRGGRRKSTQMDALTTYLSI